VTSPRERRCAAGLRRALAAVALCALAALVGCAARPAADTAAPASPEGAAAPAIAPGGPAPLAPEAPRAPAPAREAPPEAAAAPSGADPGDPMRELADAEGALLRALGGEAPRPAPRTSGDAKGGAAAPAPPRASADPCLVACRALASMRRSAARLCELSGATRDPRCDDARARVARAEERVRARCPACHEGAGGG
jgi:hypothetical protein